MHIGGNSLSRIWPCFDPNSEHGVFDCAISDNDSRHWFLILVLSEASNANPVTRTTCHLLDDYLLASVADRDTIVTSFDPGIAYSHPARSSNMDPVGVGTYAGGVDDDVLNGHVPAVVHVHVEELAVC